MIVNNISVFIPGKNFEISAEFYTDLGFVSDYVSDDLSIFANGQCTFFLQRHYNQEFAENLMLQICVLNIDLAYQSANSARHKQKITGIKTEHWGKVFYIWGPSGELLHITQLGC